MIKRILKKVFYLVEFINLSDFFIVLFRTLVFEFNRNILKKPFITAKIYDFKLNLSVKKEGIERVLAVKGKRELDQRYIIESLLKENDAIMDIGAHLGYYSVMAAMLTKKTGRIYAFEPDPRNFAALKKNIELNGAQDIIFPHNLAVSNHNGKAEFYITEKTNLGTLNRDRFKYGSDPRKYEKTEIKVMDMGGFLDGLKDRLNLIRMDVEGHEVEILDSLLRLLKTRQDIAPDYVIFETHFVKYDEARHDINKILLGLFDIGYRVNLASSFDERDAKFKDFGYRPNARVKEYPFLRGIYADLANEDALSLIQNGSTRTIALKYKRND